MWHVRLIDKRSGMSRWERIVRSSSEGRRLRAKMVAWLDEAVGE